MSSQTGLSGLNAAAKNLDIIGNNISNANTVGYKVARAEFSDLIASSAGASGGDGSGGGIGVAISKIAQQFTQGGINVTGNGLDIALNGSGFFQLKQPDGTLAYTRNGQFKLDKEGALVTNSGANVMGFPTDVRGNVTSSTPTPMVIPAGAPIPAKQTANVTSVVNLDARSPIATSVSPPRSITTYGTTLNGFDSQGLETPITLAFVRVGPDPTLTPPLLVDTWNVFDARTLTSGDAILKADAPVGAINAKNFALDKTNTALNTASGNLNLPTYTNPGLLGAVLPAPLPLPSASLPIVPPATTSSGALFQITFDAAGQMIPLATAPTVLVQSPNPAIAPNAVTIDLGATTQYGTAFAVVKLTQDGYTAGNLTGVSINESGIITTNYSNGQSQMRGKIALGDFRNTQGLAQLGGGNWAATDASGLALIGAPGEGSFAKLRPGAVEESNVDLTAELVAMMTAQRLYQANAQTIKTQDQALQTLVNLR